MALIVSCLITSSCARDAHCRQCAEAFLRVSTSRRGSCIIGGMGGRSHDRDRDRAMVLRLPPPGAPVVAGSTPVVSFGDPDMARAATLGINPSRREFVDAHGRLLDGPARRLATVDSIGSGRFDELNDAQIAAVVGDCASYFDRNPYRVWFDPLDRLLRDALGVSYYEGTACHLDLVQWATDPVWGKITDAGVRKALLEDGRRHLAEQLTHSNVRLVLLNGRQVIDQLQAVGLASLTEVDRLPLGCFGCRMVRGEASGIVFVGWSANLQSSWGVTAAFKTELARWLSRNVADADPDICAPAPREPDPLPAGVMLDEEGHLVRGLVVHGKQALLRTLAHWLRDSSAATIGEVATFGGRAHIHLHFDGIDAVLNADTKRAAVNTYVQIADRDGPDVQWQVIANRRGVVNKVLPTLAINALPGWYCYLTNPLSAPERL